MGNICYHGTCGLRAFLTKGRNGMNSKIRINTVADLLGALQGVANEGFNIHAIEVLTECEHCCSDIALSAPTLEILMSEDNHSVKLLFRNDS